MFRVEFFVDDKKLAEALRALVGISHGPPGVVPVVNAVKKDNGELVAKTNGGQKERWLAALADYKGKQFTGPQMRMLMKELGLNGDSASYLLSSARKNKLIKSSGTTSKIVYTVI